MCGLFGFTCYGNEIKNLSKLTNALSVQSAVRGTDAVGIAFAKGNNIVINKGFFCQQCKDTGKI